MTTEEKQRKYMCTNCSYVSSAGFVDQVCPSCGIGHIREFTFWVQATPLKCPSRWDVIKQDVSIWWRKNAGDPDDPNGLGVNLLQTIFWAILLGCVIGALALFG